MTMKIEARLTYDKVRFDQDCDAHLIVSVTAPLAELTQKRQPLCIIPVIDVSPSMQGRKFEYAKKSVLKLIDNLTVGDYCGLLKFSAGAEVVAPPVKITPESKEALKAKVGDLRLGSATNIADAILRGLEVANHMDLSADVITRVILFTDGEANTGVAIKPDDILKLVEPNLGLATLSAFGYGTDAQQDLLAGIARMGKANYAFVANPDDALSAFGKELGGLLSTYATDLVLEVSPLAGHQITKVISDVEADESDIGGEVTIKIPNVLGEETRHIVMGVKLAAQKSPFPRAVNVFDVKLGYDTLDANSRKEHNDADTKVKAQFVKPGEEQEKPHQEIDKIAGLAQVVRAQIEAEELAKKGNYAAAVNHMQGVGAEVKSRGHIQIQALAASVGSRLGSAGAYSSSSSYLRSVSGGGTRGVGMASYDASAEAELQGLGVVTSNSVQSNTSSLFQADDEPEQFKQAVSGIDFSKFTVNPMDFSGALVGTPDQGIAGAAGSASPGQFSTGAVWVAPNPSVTGGQGGTNNLGRGILLGTPVPAAPAVPAKKISAKKAEKVSKKKVSQSKSTRW